MLSGSRAASKSTGLESETLSSSAGSVRLSYAASEASLLPDEDLLEFEELLYSQASRVEMDKSGRIRVPERLLKQASLGSSVVLLGVKDHLELRDPERWAGQRDDKLAKQAELMMRARRAMQRVRSTHKED